MVEFQFIDYESPEQAKQAVKKRAVKSQAARHHWARDAVARPSECKAGTKRRGRGRPHVFDVHVLARGDAARAPLNEHTDQHTETNGELSPADCGPIKYLGAGRVDPFHSYPVEWQPFFPEIVDHYIVNMAVNISEIDGPNNKGLLRTRWFPLVMTEPATFLVVLLLAASHLYSIQKKPNVAIDLLGLKEQAIRIINEGLANPSKSHNDAMIGAVAKMCSYEAMYGNIDSYMIHMRGLQSMICARGGLSKLGLDGMLHRICLWIDLNSAFLNKTPRFFEGSFSDEPNPGQFIGSWDFDESDRGSVDRVVSE